MDTVVKRLYEGLFLIDSAQVAADWQGTCDVLEKLFKKVDAEVVSFKKWDERKLAYDINGKSRGTYILVYFKCEPAKVGGIEKDVQLSEKIMRMLILRTDDMNEGDIGKETPAMRAEQSGTGEASHAGSGSAGRSGEPKEDDKEPQLDSAVDSDADYSVQTGLPTEGKEVE